MAGMFGAIHGPDGRKINPSSIEIKGTTREKKLVDMDEIPAEYRDAIEADEFVIYGRANVQEKDADGQVLVSEALEDSLDQLFKASNISRRHKDVRVGEVLPAYELEDDTDVQIDDETFTFDKGETISTGVNPSIVEEKRGESPDDDEFWIVAKIWNDTEIAKDTRLRTLSGDLNGFSVTIYAKEHEQKSDGEYVTDLDWHSVTIGSDDQIKNKSSRYGLVEFKALFSGDDPNGEGEHLDYSVRKTMWDNLMTKAADKRGLDGEVLGAAAEAAQKAQNEDMEITKAVDDVVGDTDVKSESVLGAINTLTDQKAESEDDMTEVLKAVQDGDMEPEEAKSVISAAEDDYDEEMGEDEEEEDKMDEEEEEQPPVDEDKDEKSFEEKLDEHGVITEEKLDETKTEIVDTVAEKLDDSVPTADDIAQKMETGSTDDPSGGSGSDRRDYASEIQGAFSGGED